jgi:hypothetical protein
VLTTFTSYPKRREPLPVLMICLKHMRVKQGLY